MMTLLTSCMTNLAINFGKVETEIELLTCLFFFHQERFQINFSFYLT